MFCPNCGKLLGDNAKFCGKCGKEILEEQEIQKEEKQLEENKREIISKEETHSIYKEESNEENGKPQKFWEWVIQALFWIGGFFLGKYLGIVGIIFSVAILAGFYLPIWYLKKYGYKTKLINILSWLSIVGAFILPPLGVFLSISSIMFYSLAKKEDKKSSVLVLGIISLIISIVNAIFGVLLEL